MCRQHVGVQMSWAQAGSLTPGGREEEAEGPAEDLGQVRWKTREGKDLLGTAEWGHASSRRWVAESAAAGDRPDQDPESCGVGGGARLGTGLGTSLDRSVDLRVHNPHALCRAPWVQTRRVRAGPQAGGLRDSGGRARRKKGLGEF